MLQLQQLRSIRLLQRSELLRAIGPQLFQVWVVLGGLVLTIEVVIFVHLSRHAAWEASFSNLLRVKR